MPTGDLDGIRRCKYHRRMINAATIVKTHRRRIFAVWVDAVA
jgi:hypothetical protein